MWQDKASRHPPPLSTSASSTRVVHLLQLMCRCGRLCMSGRGMREDGIALSLSLAPSSSHRPWRTGQGITQCMSPASGFSLRPKCLLLSTNAYTFLRRRCRKTKLGWWWDGEWGSPLLVKGKEFDSTRTSLKPIWSHFIFCKIIFLVLENSRKKWPL